MNVPSCPDKSTTAFSVDRVFRALRYSCTGLAAAWRDEASFRQELMLFAAITALTLWIGVALRDALLLVLEMSAVLAAELLNSGLEALVDKTTPERNVLAAKAKDCGSAAVLVLLVVFAISWCLLVGPTAWARLAG